MEVVLDQERRKRKRQPAQLGRRKEEGDQRKKNNSSERGKRATKNARYFPLFFVTANPSKKAPQTLAKKHP